jgi:hypothetical protein
MRASITHQVSAMTTVLCGAVAVLLLVAASVGVVQAGFALWVGLTVHATTNNGLLALDQMLLVLMLIEILHTVRISIRAQRLTMVPFPHSRPNRIDSARARDHHECGHNSTGKLQGHA